MTLTSSRVSGFPLAPAVAPITSLFIIPGRHEKLSADSLTGSQEPVVGS